MLKKEIFWRQSKNKTNDDNDKAFNSFPFYCLDNKFYEEGKVQNDDAYFAREIRMDELKVLEKRVWLVNER